MSFSSSLKNLLRLDCLQASLWSYAEGWDLITSLSSKKDTVLIQSDNNLLNPRFLETLFNVTKSNSLLLQKFYTFDYTTVTFTSKPSQGLSWSVSELGVKGALPTFLGR